MKFKHTVNDQPKDASCSTPIEKNFLSFQKLHQISSKKPTSNELKTVQTLHFRLKKTKALLRKT